IVVYTFGSISIGQLACNYAKSNGSKNAQQSRANNLLQTAGVVQVAVGRYHCVALTYDQKIMTWGANNTGALGRDTKWEPSAGLPDGELDDDGNEDGLSPLERTPAAIPAENFANDVQGFAQVAATKGASFALTTTGFVY